GTFRVHLDGYDQLAHLTDGAESARTDFYYFSDIGDLVGFRYDRWKLLFMNQEFTGMDVWFESYDELHTPRLVDLRTDPFERAIDDAGGYELWLLQHLFLATPMMAQVNSFLSTFEEFPPRNAAPPAG
ncbi:MAG: hypothetical protein KC438_14685, partial [Thermomicrobiales bacterium]|nr:hypothetical protein [Thermomicrobiales bacterium]